MIKLSGKKKNAFDLLFIGDPNQKLDGFNQTISLSKGTDVNEKDPLILKIQLKNLFIHIALIQLLKQNHSIENVILKLKEWDPHMYIIVSPLLEGNINPNAQRALAIQCIQAGADLVMGVNPSSQKELEIIHHRWIIYNVGNAIFHSSHLLKTPIYFVANLLIESNKMDVKVKIRLIPLIHLQNKNQYRSLEEDEFEAFYRLFTSQHPHTPIEKGQNSHGHYLELAQEIITSHSVGMLTSIAPPNKAWICRAYTMDTALKHENARLFCFAPNHVNFYSRRVIGYMIEKNNLIKIMAPIPNVNFKWYVYSTPERQKYLEWSKKMGIDNFPSGTFFKFTNDKYETFQCFENIEKNLHPYSELFTFTVEQIEDFLKKSSLVFLKPRFGSQGNGIIVIKRKKDHFLINMYQKKDVFQYQVETLKDIIHEIKSFSEKREYIIQVGVDVPKYKHRTFDIRFIMLNDGKEYHPLYLCRVGKEKSDLSNVAQGGFFHHPESVLTQTFGEEMAEAIIKKQMQLSFKIMNALESTFKEKIIELSIDWIVDKEGKFYISEINTDLTIAGGPEYFPDFFNMSDEEKKMYEQYSVPHLSTIAKFLLTQYRKK